MSWLHAIASGHSFMLGRMVLVLQCCGVVWCCVVLRDAAWYCVMLRGAAWWYVACAALRTVRRSEILPRYCMMKDIITLLRVLTSIALLISEETALSFISIHINLSALTAQDEAKVFKMQHLLRL
jgi:hypothetical protein